MFILSTKQTNLKEDLFFSDVADKEQALSFSNKLYECHKDSFYKQHVTYNRYKENDAFVLHKQLGYFKTIQQARDYFNFQTDSTDVFRLQSRQWNQEHQILSNTYITDVQGNTKLILLNCIEQVCERFGGKCNEETGCSTAQFVSKDITNKKPFPIKVVVG